MASAPASTQVADFYSRPSVPGKLSLADESEFLAGKPVADGPKGAGADAPTTVEETTGATQAGTPKAQAKGKSIGGRRPGANQNTTRGPNPSTPRAPKGVWVAKKPVAQEGSVASATASSTGGNSPQVASANPPAVQEKSAKRGAGANQRRGDNHQHPRVEGGWQGPAPCRNGPSCFALLRGFCNFYHCDEEKANAKAKAMARIDVSVAEHKPKLCEKGTRENCTRYMSDHHNGHVCKKQHADNLTGVESIYLGDNTWASNHVKYVEAQEAKAKAIADAVKANADAVKAKTDADEARNCASNANRTAVALEQRLMQAEATLASVGIFPQPVMTSCWFCQQGRCDGRCGNPQ